MMKSENGQKGFGVIKMLVKLAILAILVAFAAPRVVPILQNQGFTLYAQNITSSINSFNANNNGGLLQSNTDINAPMYKQVIDYIPNVATTYNVKIIISAIQSYQFANDGNLPQSDADVESCLSKPIASLGPPGSTYRLTYTSSVVTVMGTSPSSTIFSAEVYAQN